MDRIYRAGDRYLGGFLLFHVVVGLILAPYHETWTMAFVVGALALAAFLGAVRLAPGTLLTRCVAAAALQLFAALHVYQLHGVPEMHFFFFTATTMLVAYQDWRAPWLGACLIAARHLAFAVLWPAGVEMGDVAGPSGSWAPAFHVGIALLQAAICGLWASVLRRHTLRDAWHRRQIDAARRKAIRPGEASPASAPARGATVALTLPAAAAARPEPVPAGAKASPRAGRAARRSVLLVEDDAVDQLVAMRMLQIEDCDVDIAANGIEAIASVEARIHLDEPAYDLVLMDCRMPAMDGFEATRRLRAMAAVPRDLPIVGLTTSVLEEDRERCREAGMDGALAKPLQRNTLLEVLSELVPRQAA